MNGMEYPGVGGDNTMPFVELPMWLPFAEAMHVAN